MSLSLSPLSEGKLVLLCYESMLYPSSGAYSPDSSVPFFLFPMFFPDVAAGLLDLVGFLVFFAVIMVLLTDLPIAPLLILPRLPSIRP